MGRVCPVKRIMRMSVGTRSVLFGVHNFLWHPFTVWLAWRSLYGKSPSWVENLAIFFHDWGYVGKPNMDGDEGQTHPVAGAHLAGEVARWIEDIGLAFRHPWRSLTDRGFGFERYLRGINRRAEVYRLCIGHSRYYAAKFNVPLSPLFRADKACIFFDPQWFYLLRADASGELVEFMRNSKLGPHTTPEQWFDWYRLKVKNLLAE